jgi:hypothetical protein
MATPFLPDDFFPCGICKYKQPPPGLSTIDSKCDLILNQDADGAEDRRQQYTRGDSKRPSDNSGIYLTEQPKNEILNTISNQIMQEL